MIARRFTTPGPALACAVVLGLGLGPGLAACSTVGDRYQAAAVNTIADGMTSEQVIRLLDAEPFYVSPGRRRMDFGYVEVVAPHTYRHRVTVLFGADGRVVGVPPGGILGPRGKAYADLVGQQG